MKFFNLYTTTIITIGYKKSCIFDLEKSIFYEVPKSLGIFFQKNSQINLELLRKKSSVEDYDTICEYINFLITNKLGLLSNQKIKFSKIIPHQEENNPYLFECLIIDSSSSIDLFKFIKKVSNFQLFRFVQIRLFFAPKIKTIEKFIDELFCKSNFNVEIIFNKNTNICISEYKELLVKKSGIISRFVIMNTGENRIEMKSKLILDKNRLVHKSQCGIIKKELFMTNHDSYVNSCLGNSCLYKKISIDLNGNIKNCPSMHQTFGNIKNTTLAQAVNHPDFKKYWYITKDKIEVCKDCEYRYICTDCRAYIKNHNNIYSQPAKCKYNPYIAKWEGEEGYVPVEKSIAESAL
ncbi:MAG: gwsS [Bacteroidetes bacterium]|nr:gwsS [Bacteroidota bacterium]